jgi:hypothetical protein
MIITGDRRESSVMVLIVGFVLVVQSASRSVDAANSTTTIRKEQKTAEAQIWALEQAYWEFNRDAKHEQIIATWHEKFLGWPEGEPRPINTEGGTLYIRDSYAEPATYTFEIERMGFSKLKNVAVNHYSVHLKWKDGQKRSMRITHTWVREDAGWKVLGGMSDSQ